MDELERKLKAKIPGDDTGIEVRKSICAICDPQTQCGLDLYVRDGRIVKVEGSKENPHSGGTLCSKGSATRQYVYHEDRLRTPLKRVGPRGSGEFVPISWDEALEEVVANLQRLKAESGPESVVFFVGYPKQMRPFVQRLALQFGSPNFCTESSTCFTAMAMAFRLVYGQMAGPDVPNTRCLLVWSANPFYANTTGARGLLDAVDRGMKLIVVDPRRTPLRLARRHPSAAQARHRRGAGARHGQRDHRGGPVRPRVRGRVHARLRRVPGLRGRVRPRARGAHHRRAGREDPRGGPAVRHDQAGRPHAERRAGGAQHQRRAELPRRLLAHRPHRQLRRGRRQSGRPLQLARGRRGRVRHPAARVRAAAPAGRPAAPGGGGPLPRLGRAGRPGPVDGPAAADPSGDPYPLRGLVAFGLNHRMFPGSERFLEAIQQLDFICDVDLFATDASRYADIVLPACSSVERSELRCYPEKYVLLTEPAIAPAGRGPLRHRHRLRPGAPPRPGRPAAQSRVRQRRAAGRRLRGRHGLDPRAERHDRWRSCGSIPAACRSRRRCPTRSASTATRAFPRPPARWSSPRRSCRSTPPGSAIDALPTYRPPKHSAEATPELAREYPFILNTGSRLPMFVHSRTYRLPWTRSLRPDPAADLNPADARRLGIAQGDRIELATPSGAIRVLANLTELGQPGVVHMYHGCPEADVNTLLDPDYLDPISGFPGFKALLCSVRKVEARRQADVRRGPRAIAGAPRTRRRRRSREPRLLPGRRALQRLLRLRRRLHGPERHRGGRGTDRLAPGLLRRDAAPSRTRTCATSRSPACTARTRPACSPARPGAHPARCRHAGRPRRGRALHRLSQLLDRLPVRGAALRRRRHDAASATSAASGSRPAWSPPACASARRRRCGRAARTSSA